MFVSLVESRVIIFNLAFFFFLFISLGMNLFLGVIEKRCRLTSAPETINGISIWLIDEQVTELCKDDSDCQEKFIKLKYLV